MIAIGNFKSSQIRSSFLRGLGSHLAVNGMFVLVIYYLVTHISSQHARELLGWVVPVAQGCCFFAAVSLAASLSAARARASSGQQARSRGWMIQKIMPIGNGEGPAAKTSKPVERTPSPAELEATLTMLNAIDWKVFKDLGVGYFRELGFRVLDQPRRSKGVDLLVYKPTNYSAVVAVRCMPWGTREVDLKQVRDFHRAMLLAGAQRGVMLTTGLFAEEALEFGEANNLELLGGAGFAARLLSLPPEASEKLLREAAGAERIRDEGKEQKRSRTTGGVRSL